MQDRKDFTLTSMLQVEIDQVIKLACPSWTETNVHSPSSSLAILCEQDPGVFVADLSVPWRLHSALQRQVQTIDEQKSWCELEAAITTPPLFWTSDYLVHSTSLMESDALGFEPLRYRTWRDGSVP